MSDLKQIFEAAMSRLRLTGSRSAITQEQALRLHALHLQALHGDAASQRMTFADLDERSRHEAWIRLRGMSRDDAMRRYIAEVEDIFALQRRA
ncbi:acyl-CoA-binding protein [Solimonas sp. K1W22B-7]|uniref:acyl-CoA-binding protein n=1 Tax=Solimonas sp. K1W22B-7 TaxID=2303331 RepID=UPI0013C4A751|nr:acyl-CoA-binding protein [Solimonas sp. K1W22B-7]